ncbi:MAG TPA: pyridoxamine 5'-phosphate oxidase [Desulfuromonadales bacterium]|nr:pyridoxamine 5'-phosphate oxidase [Desulfuromonadales bacterium]
MEVNNEVPLLRDSMNADPFRQFLQWFQEAEQAGMPLPNAMNLATSTQAGRPSVRMVLLKGVDDRGLIFHTNYQSRKGQEIKENPFAAIVFYWSALARQVRIEGKVEKLDPAESEAYFASRPRGSQIGAHASPQSQVVADRDALVAIYQAAEKKFSGKSVPRPENWGGYRLVPQIFEFWQEGANRIHDRLRYRRDEAGDWVLERLAP